MRMRIATILVLSFMLSSCAQIADVGRFVTTTVVNPIGQVDVYRLKNTYAAALQLVVDYRAFCWSKPYTALMADPVAGPICQNRRQVVRVAQSTRPKAAAAIRVAENFVRNNDTLNVSTAITAAWQAVTDFQNSVPRVR